MADEAKPTVASLATTLRQHAEDLSSVDTSLTAVHAKADQADEAASTAVKITELQGKDIADLKRDQLALAKLVNGLNREPGDAVKPDRLDNVLARLETVERTGRQDWTPMMTAHGERVDKLAVAVTALDNRVTAVEDKAGVQPGGPFEDLAQQFDQLQAAVARLEHAGPDMIGAPVHQALVDLVNRATGNLSERLQKLERDNNPFDDARALVAAELDDRIRQIVRNRASFEQDLLARVRNLEDSGLPGGLGATTTHIPAVGNVHAKLLELMREVDHIAKTKTASGKGMNYKFRGIDDAQNAVGQAMRKIGLLLQPEVLSWEYAQTPVDGFDDKGRAKTTVWSTSRLTMAYTFVSPDDGSAFTFSMIGEGRDAGDKSGSKAASMACKYALFQALMVPLEVDESDGDNPVAESYRDERPAASNTPGARVSRGEITPAQAVQEYTQPQPQVSKPTGYNPAMDSSAMAGADTDDTLMQKAAKAADYLKRAQQQPAEVALAAIAKLKNRVEEYEIGDMTIRWSDGETALPLKTLISTALQNVNATIAARSKAAGAQGVTRQGQQSGEGARAAAYDKFQQELAADQAPPSGYEGSEQEYNDALAALASPSVPEDVAASAMATVHAWESTR